MNTGKDSDDKSERKRLPQNKLAVITHTVTKPLKRASPSATGNVNANATIKAKSTTATVSKIKITKLVLKPKPSPPKSLATSKLTTKKYIAKPVTIKSRSTVISHESTFRIKAINKTPPNKKQSEAHAVFSLKNEQFSRQLIVNRNSSESNQTAGLSKPFEMEHRANITSLNVTQTVDGPILQEITSAVVNGSNLVKNPVNQIGRKISDDVKENAVSAKKIGTHCENDIECKPRSYDPIKARQLVRMQKEKRKEADKNESKVPASKDEIKQRLNALRKNTLKIVEKNVKNARKSNIKPATTTKTFKQKTANNEQKKTAANKRAGQKIIESTEPKIDTPKPRFGSHLKVSPTLALTPSKFVPSIKSDKNRIGILRRPEGISPTLDSGASAAQTPVVGSANVEHHLETNIAHLNASPEKSIHNSSCNEQIMQQQFELKAPDTIPLKSSLLHEISNNHLQHELHDAIQVSDENRVRDEVYFIDDATQKPREIPFWLRPTPVQPYPYNFIMAVRKKLESITNPVFSPKQRKRSKEQQMYHSPVSRPDSKFVSHFRRNLARKPSESDNSLSEHVKSSDVSPVKSVNTVESSPEQQEYSTNFSSAVESQRERNESWHDRSESQQDRNRSRDNRSDDLSKSKRKSIQASQDTLSISSGILSHSSPEKKMRASASGATEKTASAMAARQSISKSIGRDEERPPSPLTTDNVDGLHITSHSHESERISSARSVKSQQSQQSVSSSLTSLINFGRGKDYSGRSQPSFNKLCKQQDIKGLLQDFKTSLSTAIKTNELLHNILSNPPSSRTKYSDDFEHTSDDRQSQNSERISGSHESQESSIPSYKSQYTASSTKSNGQSMEIASDTRNEHSSATPINTTKMSQSYIDKSQSQLSAATKTIEEHGTMVSIEINTSLSKQKSTISNLVEEISEEEGEEGSTANEKTVETEENIEIEESSRTPKFSSTLIEEKNDDDYSSESPTNNDLKSVSLSIAKKSAPTSDDTDQPSNAIESFNKQIIGEPDVANESIGSDIFAIFNKSAFAKEDMNTSLWSEHNVSYSTLGMCDQLLKSEARKSEDLTSLLKIREKALIDRFKGQIAWLELQKQKLKESGLTTEISMIKKKQRALLLRLNNDRKELHRILKEQQQQSESARNSSNVNFNISHLSTNMSIRRTSISKQYNQATSKQAIKAIELPGGGLALERMLQKREDELRHRREHVEKLLKWHQRLDGEEQEVFKMEQMIMFISSSDVYQTSSREQINDTIAITVQRTNCQRNNDTSVHEHSLTNVSDTITMERTRFEHKKQKQIHKIEKSLNTLKMISSRSISSDIDDGSIVDDVVEIFGRQLNKLWKRLTGQYEEKYTPDKVYSLAKSDLELMYEQAKIVVLKQFHANAEFKRRLIDNSMSIVEGSQNSNVSTQHIPDAVDETSAERKSEQEIVPTLNLGSSPEPKENIISDTDQGYYFSNDNIEQISEQNPVNTLNTQSIETATSSDGTSENLGGSQIQTEEQIEEENEDDEQSESILDDIQSVHSDITEDSLNRPKPSSVEDISRTEIKTISQANEVQPDGDGASKSSQIQSAIGSGPSTVPFELNLMNETTQLIEETSFPNTDIHTTVSSVIESDMSIESQSSVSPVKKATPTVSSQQSEQKYRSDDFEGGQSADELTSISTATVTKVTTTTTPTVNQSSEKNASPSPEPSKELEQRLILIDEGMRELRETISQSPVLQSEAEIVSEKSTSSNSPSLDEEHAPEVESKETASVESVESPKSEENSEGNSENSTESETTSKTTTTENGPSVAVNESQKVDSDESTDSIAAEIAASKLDNQTSIESQAPKRPFQYTLSASSIDYNKVPEADALKRAQVPPDTEAKTTEQSSSVMFPFLREIPNKPPPPYPINPVLRQLPKAAPFPSDDRITEIVYQRVEELFVKLNSTPLPETPVRNDATFVKSPSLSITSPESPALEAETNVFERIIFDSCEEIMQDVSIYGELSSDVFRQPLEFYNPPNRLRCYQQHTLKRIYKLLNRQLPSSANDSSSYSDQRSFLPSQVAQLTFNNRRKRDAVDEILIHELYEDEARWTNFESEEKEIRENVGDLRTLLADDSVSEVHESSTNATNTE